MKGAAEPVARGGAVGSGAWPEVSTLRVLLINPEYRLSFWTLAGAAPITGRPALMPNLALPTLAALAPAGVDVRIVEEAVEPVDFDTPCDVVGITGYVTQRDRMIEIAGEFRRRGVPVVIGGPFASLSPATVRPHADILFRGEAEVTWPAFLDDFRSGRWRDEYVQEGTVDYGSSPAPRFDGMQHDRYYMGSVQTSRGCPFECEFCDVIVYLGRRQRHKDPDRVVVELENLYDLGYRQIFLADDNFTANRSRAGDILRAVAAWRTSKPEKVSFGTQLSIDVARDGNLDLLDLAVEAGLSTGFVGIETPNREALLEVKKRQNVRYDMVDHVRRMQSSGVVVQAGMIVGFDSDSRDVFSTQYEFSQEAGLTMVSLGMLNAPEGTPLAARLAAEGRLRQDSRDDFYTSTNIIPRKMTLDQLVAGVRWLMNKLYEPDAFLDRLAVLAGQLPAAHGERTLRRDAMVLWDRVRRTYQQLGPEFAALPSQGAQLFRGKDVAHLVSCLIYYCHVIRMLREWAVWDPPLAREPEPRG